jgi:hypothetical protein
MQYVGKTTLRSQLRSEGMELDRAGYLLRQIGQALSAVHEKSIFHRDLKPENVMLQSTEEDERAILIDFGIAKVKDSQVADSTSELSVAGTIAYMAPEQLMTGQSGVASDVYSMGVMAYEMMTGRRPFNPQTAWKLLEMQREGVKVMPSDLRPGLPAAAEHAILKALSFKPEDRHARAKDFGQELAEALGEGLETRERNASPAMAVAPPDGRPPKREQQGAEGEYAPHAVRRRGLGRKLGLVAAVTLLAVAAGVLGWRYLFQQPPPPDPAPPTAPQRTLSYYLMVQRMRDSQPYQEPFKSAGNFHFGTGDRFTLHIRAGQPGYLYLFSEAEPQGDADVAYYVLFPQMSLRSGSAELPANEVVKIPEGQNPDGSPRAYEFAGRTGVEHLWAVWTERPVDDLERLKIWTSPEHRGLIKDEEHSAAVARFLKERSTPGLQVNADNEKKEAAVTGAGEVMVIPIRLDHS